MRILCQWLKKYTGIEASAETLARLLTNCGLEVESTESVEKVKGGLKGIITGEVLTCRKHPNADKLSLTTVSVGASDPLNIVCGAPNVAPGQKVLVAVVGTTLHIGEKSFVVNKTAIRGEMSEGMICAEDEVGLGTSHQGIMVLDPSTPVGIPASQLYDVGSDTILEVGLTPNRADAASYIGIARDLVAVWNILHFDNPELWKKLQIPDISHFSIDNHKLTIPVEITDPNACPRYSGITISGIKVSDSPQWLKDFLIASGIRPINNVVDITNFVLFELGQPLHAFDASKISGDKVVVRTFPSGTQFTTLDDVERTLNDTDLMICNALNPMCIGGVFGGKDSGVCEQTTSIFLESAYFNPVSIRQTSKFHGLKTDASYRFERGADPNITVFALKRAAALIREIAGGEISSNIIDVYPNPVENQLIEVSFANIDTLIGQALDRSLILQLLPMLGIGVGNVSASGFVASVPPFKPDVTREADIVEEILRIYGYNNISTDHPMRTSVSIVGKPDRTYLKNQISDLLTFRGYYEIMCNSLSGSAYAQQLPFLNATEFVRILNPISRDLDVMRQSLVMGGLETIKYNINRRSSDLKLYEFGKIYFRKEGLPASTSNVEGYTERWKLGIFSSGRLQPETWRQRQTSIDFFDLKADVQQVFERLGLSKLIEEKTVTHSQLFEFASEYYVADQVVAQVGKLEKAVLKQFDIVQDVFFADIEWDQVGTQIASQVPLQYSEIIKYPEVRRDLALIIDKQTTFDSIQKVAIAAGSSLLKKISLFDIYEGDKIEIGKKSYAVSFVIQDERKTLTDDEIDTLMKRLITAFEKQLGAKLRS